jgi:hypothetical protein
MPDVATAATATAAQTRAAGSRMLGFYLGVGGVKVDVLFDTANFLTKNAAGSFEGVVPGGGTLFVEQAGSTSVQIRSSATLRFVSAVASAFQFYIAGTSLVQIGPSALTPGTDNAVPLGAASFRWQEVRAVNGTIITSDEREKTWRGGPNAAEISAARRIAAELGFFQWNDAIAVKGADGARMHFGARAQAVWAIMADEGLIDPIAEGETPSSRYAFLCYDEWPEVEAVAEERDEEGNITVEAVEARPAGNRFGIRPDQLTLFLIAAQEARIAALEAA